ncbi:hypothetical protein [Tessaracoccus sp. Z1128]
MAAGPGIDLHGLPVDVALGGLCNRDSTADASNHSMVPSQHSMAWIDGLDWSRSAAALTP